MVASLKFSTLYLKIRGFLIFWSTVTNIFFGVITCIF